jgi:RNA polymerase sigma-70 factor (ECF subfamily)
MSATPVSLLDRLRSRPSRTDWQRLDELYRPLLVQWLRRFPDFGKDADDIVQEVLLIVFENVQSFRREREGSFRTWLRRVVENQLRRAQRRARRNARLVGDSSRLAEQIEQLADPDSELSLRWDREHDQHVFNQILTLVRADYQEKTWEAFERFALRDEPVGSVSRSLGMTENAVILAKSRVLRRLRQEASGLID